MDHVPVAVVTGAGSGIGRATAVMLSARGWRLVLAGRREAPLRETAGMLAGESLVLAADVGDAAAAAGVIDAAVARFGCIDALVNNAGQAPRFGIGQSGAELLTRVFAVNALGPGVMIARAWPVFERQSGGVIVNVSTMGTVDPFPGFFAYAASKAAVESMVRSCAREGAEFGVRAFAVAPGAVDTEMLRALWPDVPAERCLSPEDVARVMVACILGERDGDNGKVIYLPSP